MKSKSLFLASVVFSLFLSACEKKQTQTISGNPEGVLIMVTSGDNPPFTFYNTAEGSQEVVGYEIDLARKIADVMKVKLEIKDTDFTGIIPALQAGRAHFSMALMTPTSDRAQHVDFSDIYFSAAPSVMTLIAHPIKKDEDFKGKKVGAQLGSVHHHLLKEILEKVPEIEIVALNRLGELVQELRAGRLDGIVMEEAVSKAYVGSHKDIVYNVLEGHTLEAAAAFPKGSELREPFNVALAQLIKSGEVDTLKKKWEIR